MGGWAQSQTGRVLSDREPKMPHQNIETWMQDKSEVEVVDLVLKLREKLVRRVPVPPSHHPSNRRSHLPLTTTALQVRAQSHQLPVKEVTLQRAQLYVETVIGSLPKGLQALLCPP